MAPPLLVMAAVAAMFWIGSVINSRSTASASQISTSISELPDACRPFARQIVHDEIIRERRPLNKGEVRAIFDGIPTQNCEEATAQLGAIRE